MKPLPNSIFIKERKNKTRYWTTDGVYFRELVRVLFLLKVTKL